MELKLTVASFKFIEQDCPIKPLLLVCNPLTASVDLQAKKNPKYKKVSKSNKQLLLTLISEGSSIISAAKKLGINYSTAKSIVQSQQKESTRKVAEQTDEDASKNALTVNPIH